MPKINLTEAELSGLLKTLQLNAEAVDETEAIRWSEQSADRIEEIKNKIESQTS
jgi:hypothetical protein